MIPDRWLVISRDVEHDVGTSVATPDEYAREGAPAIVAANSKRAQEAIRSLEECTKIEFPSAAREFEQLRYSLYDVERRLVVIGHAQNRLKNVALYWLVDPAACPRSLDWMIKRAVAGGVQMIQLRDKSSGDLERIERARAVRRWTRDLVVLLIINDRPDIARLSDADGVHLGQADLPVRDARRIVGPDMLIGVSTHNIDQARKAVADGADYLGLGPVFPSHTKSFDQYIGLDGVRQIAERIGLPVFCIGGITPSNIRQVVDSGGSRVAVSHCLCAVDDPFPIARELASLLERRAS
jgi:thiamine-phosphate pyrophosphorylase